MSVAIVAPSRQGGPYRGSERIRCDWIAPHIPAMKWRGEPRDDFDVLIFQKTMPWPRGWQIQILDVCDPFWRVEDPSEAFSRSDAVTCCTEVLAEECRALTTKPVSVVRDGHDFSVYPRSTNKGVDYVWFGYHENFPREVVEAAPEELVTVVSDKDCGYGTFHKWRDDTTAWATIAKSSVAILPYGEPWKSNNKEVAARAMGLAVARTKEVVQRCNANIGEVPRTIVIEQSRSDAAAYCAREMGRVIQFCQESGQWRESA